MRRGSVTPFESYYLPANDATPSGSSTDFPFEPISSNFSSSPEFDTSTWTYFLLNIPQGGAGGHIHFKSTSVSKMQYEVYVRFGGLPSLDVRDYYYANHTSSSASHSMFFSLYNSSQEKVDFYILYAREGTWSFGLRQLNDSTAAAKVPPTLISLSLERCPKRCSSHGQCRYAFDASGLTSYRFLLPQLSGNC